MVKKNIVFLLISAILCINAGLNVHARAPLQKEFYVSPNGNDEGDGSVSNPFKTIKRAQTAVREINSNMNGDIIVYLREGVHCLDETLNFTVSDSGSNGYYIRYKAAQNENVKISGGVKIENWEKHNDKIWKTKYTKSSIVRQLDVNNKRARRAQSETHYNLDKFYNNELDDKYEVDGLLTSESKFVRYKNKEDIQLHFARGWTSLLFNVVDIEEQEGSSLFLMRQPVFNTKSTTGNHPVEENTRFWVENAFEELDTNGEFYYDKREQMLYYMPRADEDMISAEVWLAYIEELIHISGEGAGSKVKNLVFDGITFAHAAWNRPSLVGLANGQANSMTMDEETATLTEPGKSMVPANIQLHWAEKITFTNNVVRDMGAVGIGLYQGVSYCNFIGNVFEDIADSAMSVGIANQTYMDPVHEGRNLAADKYVTASGFAAGYGPLTAVDVNKKTGWAPSGSGPHWLQIDLGEAYRIDKIEVDGRPGYDQPDTRKDFEVLASNDPNFERYVVLAKQGSVPFDKDGMAELRSNDSGEYRYVRLRKTNASYFYLSEVRIINEDLTYSPARESCKFNKIHNNYMTRIGYVNWGAPAVQGYYVENLDVSHNEIFEVPYSGICVGWGWGMYKDSTVCRDNKINYNRIHRHNSINFDGGGIYTLGQQPNSVEIGNYISDQQNYISGLYSDNGTMYYTIMNNVVENVNQAYFINTEIGYITYKNNYSPHGTGVSQRTNSITDPPIQYIPGNPPMEALEIMANSGIEQEYAHIKEKASENMWPVNPDITFHNVINERNYGSMNDSKFTNNYLKNMLSSAYSWIALAKIGDGLGQYPQSAVDELKAFLDKANDITRKNPIDRDEIISTRLDYEKAVEKFKNSKITASASELVDIAKKQIGEAQVGLKVGNVSLNNLNKHKIVLDKTEKTAATDKIMKMMLEKSILTFEAEKINLNISEFKVPSQLGKAQIDNENGIINVKVKYTTDLSYLSPDINVNGLVNLSPAEKIPMDFRDPVSYTVATKDGGESRTYTVNVMRETKIDSQDIYSLKSAIEDANGWAIFGTTENRYYKNSLFGDITLEFDAEIEAIEGDWPSIVLRNQDPEMSFGDKNNAAYIMVMTPGKIELHRFNNGVRTQFYGTVPNVTAIFGETIKSNAFVFGKKNKMRITCANTLGGVRIIVNINGDEVINIVDNYEGAITNPGYFGTISPKAQVKLSAE